MKKDITGHRSEKFKCAICETWWPFKVVVYRDFKEPSPNLVNLYNRNPNPYRLEAGLCIGCAELMDALEYKSVETFLNFI